MGIGVAFHPNPLERQTDRRARPPLFGLTYPHGDADLSADLPAQLRARRFRQPAVGHGRCREAAGLAGHAFEEKFGLRPVEGYGCTECSPVVTCNTRDFRAAGLSPGGQHAAGSIGHPMPGVSVRLVDPETGAPMPLGQAGLLLVRGPNVMRGYLESAGQDRRGPARWLVRHWRHRGPGRGWLPADHRPPEPLQQDGRRDGAAPEGGGEAARGWLGASTAAFVVAGVPDPKKGERLVVLHTLPEDELQVLLKKLPQWICPTCGFRAPTSSSASRSCPGWPAARWTCAKSAIWPPRSLSAHESVRTAPRSWPVRPVLPVRLIRSVLPFRSPTSPARRLPARWPSRTSFAEHPCLASQFC